MKNGKIQGSGEKNQIIALYERWCQENQLSNADLVPNNADSPVKIESVAIKKPGGELITNTGKGEDIQVVIRISGTDQRKIHIGVGFRSISGDNIFGVSTKSDSIAPIPVNTAGDFAITFPDIQLLSGSYQAFAVVLDEHALHVYDLKLSQIVDIINRTDMYGKIHMEHQWQI